MTNHLPVGCMKIGTSFSVPTVTDMRELVPPEEPVAIVVGAFAHGSVRVVMVGTPSPITLIVWWSSRPVRGSRGLFFFILDYCVLALYMGCCSLLPDLLC